MVTYNCKNDDEKTPVAFTINWSFTIVLITSRGKQQNTSTFLCIAYCSIKISYLILQMLILTTVITYACKNNSEKVTGGT